MFEYMTVQEAAKLWEVSERQVQKANRTEPDAEPMNLWEIIVRL